MVPLSDGGEGFLEVVRGAWRTTTVTGPLGRPVQARWRIDHKTAYIEMAEASGLSLVGGAEGNDAMAASTAGTGELILAAVAAGARRVVVGAGGSATTDGGLGAVEALAGRTRGVDVVVACDVRSTFGEAASVFAGQKGASAAEVGLLTARLERVAQLYRDRYGVDVSDLEGAGAAGGLAGGLAAATGAQLVAGFDVVAEATGLFERVEEADLVVTAEGFVDDESFNGKVVGGVVEAAGSAAVDVLIVAGDVLVPVPVPAVSMVDRFGGERSRREAVVCVEEIVFQHLDAR